MCVRACVCTHKCVWDYFFCLFFPLQFPGLCFWKDVGVITVLCTELSFVLKKNYSFNKCYHFVHRFGILAMLYGGDDPHPRANEWGSEADSCTSLCTSGGGRLSGHDMAKRRLFAKKSLLWFNWS